MENKRQYNTKQKNCILNYFKVHSDKCFSAKEIIDSNDFHIGEATVYRLLTKLTKEGSLKKFIADKGSGATYQYNDKAHCDNHFHLQCLNCGQAVCMDCLFLSGVEKHIENEHEFSVDNTKTILYGVCKACNVHDLPNSKTDANR